MLWWSRFSFVSWVTFDGHNLQFQTKRLFIFSRSGNKKAFKKTLQWVFGYLPSHWQYISSNWLVLASNCEVIVDYILSYIVLYCRVPADACKTLVVYVSRTWNPFMLECQPLLMENISEFHFRGDFQSDQYKIKCYVHEENSFYISHTYNLILLNIYNYKYNWIRFLQIGYKSISLLHKFLNFPWVKQIRFIHHSYI